MKGRSLWPVAGLALLATLLSACGDDKRESQRREKAKRRSAPSAPSHWNNPADRPGATVFEPRALPGAHFNEARERVEDSNGDYLVLDQGHAGGEGQYTYGNQSTGLKAYGAWHYAGGDTHGLSVYEVIDLKTELGAAPQIPQSAYRLDRIAEMFRAHREARSGDRRGKRILVVDSRPK